MLTWGLVFLKKGVNDLGETLTRADIIKTLGQSVELSVPQASDFLESTLEIIIASLLEDGHVKIAGFGSFNIRKKPRRFGRNPRTKKEAMISPRNVALFKASGHLRKKVQLGARRRD